MDNTKTYVIYDDLYYKIGKTNNLEKRLSSIKTGNIRARILYYFENNIEKELHSKFKDKRISGEWFDLSKEDLLYIQNTFIEYVEKGKKSVIKNDDDIDFKGNPFIIVDKNGTNKYVFNPHFNLTNYDKKALVGKNSGKLRRELADYKIHTCIQEWDIDSDGKITLAKIAQKTKLGVATLKRRGKDLKELIQKVNEKLAQLEKN